MWRTYTILSIWLLCFGTNMAQDTFKVGLIKYKSEEDFVATYEPFVEYIAKELGRIPQYEIVHEEELGYRLANNEFDMGVFTPFPYLKAKLSFPELEVFGGHRVNGADFYVGAIMVLQESGIQNLEDLQGKKFLFVKESSTSGYKYPKGIFKEHNIEIDSGFFDYSFSGGHDISARSLLNKEVDGIAIDESGLDGLTNEERMKIHRLGTYEVPYHAYLFSPALDQETSEKVREIMFNAHKVPASQNKHMFKNPLGINQWVERNDDYYNSLRRYLRIVRIKPSIMLAIKTSKSAEEALTEKGDFLKVLKDDIINELKESKRFEVVGEVGKEKRQNYNLKVDLSVIGKEYRCQAYLGETRVLSENVNFETLQKSIPPMIVMRVLKHLPIETELLSNLHNDWFITFGADDGLNVTNYEFLITLPNGEEHHIEAGYIEEMTDLNTFFKYEDEYQKGQKVSINFVQTELKAYLQSKDEYVEEAGFWDHLDNIWGVIGLVVAMISVAVGSFFTRRKHRRFRRMLGESNELLKEYIDGKYKLDNKVIESKQKLTKYLEKGYISENQFLILKNRLEDIHQVINVLLVNSETVPETVREQVREIIKDGVITEREYAELMKLVKNLN